MSEKTLPKLCLNMIVKNESRVIRRLLKSVANIIDTYCICDTGSTDNTIELIETFFKERNISGKIVNEPFRDFGYNRSFALNECFKMEDVDYILLLDADMILTGSALNNPTLLKERLVDDVYFLFQGNSRFFYKNARIIKNNGFSYWGVTHEYLKTSPGSTFMNIDKSDLFIEDIGDGGAKSDKHERDIRLLRKGLEDEPNNDRYTFYLANTYRDAGNHELAIEYYKKRIEIGGWIEEIWQSYYSIGKCYLLMNDSPNAVYYFLEGFQVYPNRIENLYQIVQYYRNNSKNRLAYQYYLIGKKVLEKMGTSNDSLNDFLFLEKDVYEYKLDYEFSIIGYYENPDSISLNNLCMKLLACPIIENGISLNILKNFKFYVEKISDNKVIMNSELSNIISKIGFDSSEFNTSTPSLCILNNQLVINTRFVNYTINDQGNYFNKEHIETKNIISVIDLGTYEMVSEFELGYNDSLDNIYVGLEDVRLFSTTDGKILYNANRGLGNSNIKVEHGMIDLGEKTTKNDVLLTFREKENQIEKNWTLFQSEENEIKSVYNWFPLTIGDIQENEFIKTHEQSELPDFFRYIRGSTNGQVIDDEIWFLCHLVSYEDRRYYYHIMVVLDRTTFVVKKYSNIFTFEKEPVEYTLGFVEMGSDLLIGYSILDKETKYMMVPKDWFTPFHLSNADYI